MPLVRATLPTALSTVRQMIGDLKKLVRETGSSPSLDNIVLNLDALDAYGGRKSLDVEVVVMNPLDPEEAARIATWIGPGFHPGRLLTAAGDPAVVEVPGPPVDLRVQTRTASARMILKAGAPRPPVLVILATKPFALSEEDRANLERAFEDRPSVTLVASAKKPAVPAAAPPEGDTPEEGGAEAPAEVAPPAQASAPADEPWFKDLEAKAKAGAWTCVTHRTVPEMNLQTRLSAGPMELFQELFRAHSAAVALESLSGVFDMVLQQQQNEIRVNRSVTQQKMAKFGPAKPGPGAAPSPIADLLADLKSRVQRLSQEFERGAADRLQDLLGQPAGLLVRETEQLLGSLEELDLEEKVKTLGCRVPAAFEEKVNKLIREKVGRHCAVDLVALNDLFRLIGQEFDRTLAQAQGPPIVVQFRYLTDERVRRMLDMFGIFQSVYKGEMPRPGFGEYFSSVRKYSMILVMVASMFGLSAMVRQFREFTVPLTVLLVAFGTYQVAITTKRTRIENTETQLEAARTAMRQDIRRIITELQKQWGTILNQYLNEQISAAIGELDAALKQYQGRKGPVDADPERDRLQRQLAALDVSEKRIAVSGKTKDTLGQSISQVRGDLKGLMAAPGAAPARPGMPGAGAPPRPGAPGAGGAGLAGARPAMPAKPAGPSAVAEAKAKLEAMKAAKAAPPAAKPAAPAAAPAAPAAAAPAAPAAGGPSALQAKMAAMKAARAGGAAAPAPAAADAPPPAPAPAPAGETPAAPAAAPAAGEAKPGGASALQAKMAAMKAARAGGAPAPAGEAAAGAEAAAAPKPGAGSAFQAKMAAMKAAKAAPAAAAAGAAVATAPEAAAPPPEPAEPASEESPPAEEAPAAPAEEEPAPAGEHGFAETMAIPPAEKVTE